MASYVHSPASPRRKLGSLSASGRSPVVSDASLRWHGGNMGAGTMRLPGHERESLP